MILRVRRKILKLLRSPTIPRNNPPKQFCKWSFEQGDRKWQQNELELGGAVVSVLDRLDREDVRLHQPNASVVDLLGM